jgi:serine/threonine-protein kinase
MKPALAAALALACLAMAGPGAGAAAPDTMGSFRILKEASHANGRIIYAAVNPVAKTPVFIKAAVEREMDKASFAEAAAGFAHEAKAAAVLKGLPGVLQVLETGRVAGMAYLAIEGVTGQELGGLLADGTHPAANDTAQVMASILDALDTVHKRGVVHRDLKPANIVLGTDGRVKIADFGVSKLPGKDPYAGVIVGTPAYMSPEQVKGEALDGRSDLFSAGVILYQLLTGRLPFGDPNPQVTFNKVLALDPPAPSSIDGSVPTAYDAIVAKALAKKPEARYASAREFASALRKTTIARK